jgi:hypothetical protein
MLSAALTAFIHSPFPWVLFTAFYNMHFCTDVIILLQEYAVSQLGKIGATQTAELILKLKITINLTHYYILSQLLYGMKHVSLSKCCSASFLNTYGN